MRISFKTLVLVPAILAAAVVATNTASAEETLKVPFSFTVAGKLCPAGTYKVDKNASNGIVTLRNVETAKTFNWILRPGYDAPKDTKVVLKFDEIGQTRVLQSVQFGPLTTSRLDNKEIKNSEFAPIGNSRGR
jgi:hypothetical protein